jgi:hypothetical protein
MDTNIREDILDAMVADAKIKGFQAEIVKLDSAISQGRELSNQIQRISGDIFLARQTDKNPDLWEGLEDTLAQIALRNQDSLENFRLQQVKTENELHETKAELETIQNRLRANGAEFSIIPVQKNIGNVVL